MRDRAKVRKNAKAYYERHYDRIRACQTAYRLANRETLLAKAKEAYRKNPERYMEYKKSNPVSAIRERAKVTADRLLKLAAARCRDALASLSSGTV